MTTSQLLGLLNSSAACFWMKQVFHNKGSAVDQHGARQRTTPFEDFYRERRDEVTAASRSTGETSAIDAGTGPARPELKAHSPAAILAQPEIRDLEFKASQLPAPNLFGLRERMIALQEELDWECYRHYGLLAENVNLSPASPDLPQIQLRLGERAFEIVMARKMAGGELETTWFERHGSTPITELPAHWPAAYRQLVERRIAFIESDRNIALIEQPEYKRRWNTEPWEQQQERALREWLLARLEDPRYWPAPELTSCAHLADKVRQGHRVHGSGRALPRPPGLRPHGTGGGTGRERIGAVPACAPLQGSRPAETGDLGTGVGLAAPGGRH